MGRSGEQSKHLIRYVELLLLAATLLATVIISALTLRQTTEHFRIERTTGFVSRFNSREMVELRGDVDRWLETDESPTQLFDRSQNTTDSTNIASDVQENQTEALDMLAKLRTMANYFQEFGTALEVGSPDERYAHELLGALCIRYANALEPFIKEARIRMERPQLYEEVISLRIRMEALDVDDG